MCREKEEDGEVRGLEGEIDGETLSERINLVDQSILSHDKIVDEEHGKKFNIDLPNGQSNSCVSKMKDEDKLQTSFTQVTFSLLILLSYINKDHSNIGFSDQV